MKKIFIGLCFLLASIPSMAAGANKMTMVTYFPVKYVAYSQVDVMKQMDVGLTSACQMNLGCSADEGFNTGKSLRVNNLLKIAGGKLELNDAPAIEGSTAHIGSGNGVSDFDFKTSLRVGNYKQGYTLQADNMYLSELNLFGYKFPACSGETMSWQKLKLKNKEEVYLVCGEAEQVKNPCEGKVASTWDGTQCVCPNSGEHYVVSTDACCSENTPKTNTKCWNKSYYNRFEWKIVDSGEETCLRVFNSSCNLPYCSKSCDTLQGFDYGVRRCNSEVRVGNGCVEDAPAGVYKGSTGEKCLYSCQQSDVYNYTGACTGVQNSIKKIGWQFVQCTSVGTKEVYTPLWH